MAKHIVSDAKCSKLVNMFIPPDPYDSPPPRMVSHFSPDSSIEEDDETSQDVWNEIIMDMDLVHVDDERDSSSIFNKTDLEAKYDSSVDKIGDETAAAIESINRELDMIDQAETFSPTDEIQKSAIQIETPPTDIEGSSGERMPNFIASRTASDVSTLSSFPTSSIPSSDDGFDDDGFNDSRMTVGLRESEEVAEVLSRQVFSLRLDLVCRDRKIQELKKQIHELEGRHVEQTAKRDEDIPVPRQIEEANSGMMEDLKHHGAECKEIMTRVLLQIEKRDGMLNEIGALIEKVKSRLERIEHAEREAHMRESKSSTSFQNPGDSTPSHNQQRLQQKTQLGHRRNKEVRGSIYHTPHRERLKDHHEYTPASLWTNTITAAQDTAIARVSERRKHVPISSRRTSIQPAPNEHLQIPSRISNLKITLPTRRIGIRDSVRDGMSEQRRLHTVLNTVIEESTGYHNRSTIRAGNEGRILDSPIQLRSQQEASRLSTGSTEDVWCYLASPKKSKKSKNTPFNDDAWSNTTKVATSSATSITRTPIDVCMAASTQRRSQYTPKRQSSPGLAEAREMEGQMLSSCWDTHVSDHQPTRGNYPASRSSFILAQQLTYRQEIERRNARNSGYKYEFERMQDTLLGKKYVHDSVYNFQAPHGRQRRVSVYREIHPETSRFPHEWRREMISREPPSLAPHYEITEENGTTNGWHTQRKMDQTNQQTPPNQSTPTSTVHKDIANLSLNAHQPRFIRPPPNLSHLRSRIPIPSPPTKNRHPLTVNKTITRKRKSLNLNEESALASPSKKGSLHSSKTTPLTRNSSYGNSIKPIKPTPTVKVSADGENVQPTPAPTVPKTPKTQTQRASEQDTTARKMAKMNRRRNGSLFSGGKGLGKGGRKRLAGRGFGVVDSVKTDADKIDVGKAAMSPAKTPGGGMADEVRRLLRFDMW